MAANLLDTKSVESALLRYRIVALIVSVLLVVLFGIGLPLQYAGGHGSVDEIVGVAHGVFFYPLYILLTLDLTRRVRMTPIQLVLTVAAGTIPLASFYAERRTTEFIRARQAALAAQQAPAQPVGESVAGGSEISGSAAGG
jgi:integral membrane protein